VEGRARAAEARAAGARRRAEALAAELKALRERAAAAAAAAAGSRPAPMGRAGVSAGGVRRPAGAAGDGDVTRVAAEAAEEASRPAWTSDDAKDGDGAADSAADEGAARGRPGAERPGGEAGAPGRRAWRPSSSVGESSSEEDRGADGAGGGAVRRVLPSAAPGRAAPTPGLRPAPEATRPVAEAAPVTSASDRPAGARAARGVSPAPAAAGEDGVSARLVTRIQGMTTSQLRALLTSARIPHAGCVEKDELRQLLVKAVRRGAALHAAGGGADDAAAAAAAAAPGAASRSGSDAEAPSRSGSDGGRADGGPMPGGAQHGAGRMRLRVASSEPGEDDTARGGVTPVVVGASHAEGGAPSRGAGPPPSPEELKSWLPAYTDDGQTYFYHRHTRAVRWDRPTPEVARQVDARVEASRQKVEERRALRVRQLAEEEDRRRREAEEKDSIRGRTERRVNAWARGRPLRSLLVGLADFVPWAAKALPTNLASAAATGDATAVKKAHLRSLRAVHPDKMAGADAARCVEAELVFAALQAAWARFEADPAQQDPSIRRHGSFASGGHHAASVFAAARASDATRRASAYSRPGGGRSGAGVSSSYFAPRP